MSGRGEPWQIMYSNVANLLGRAAMLHKYPHTREQTVKPCLPHLDVATGQWTNLRAAVRFAMHTQFWVEVPSLEAPGSKGHTLFWVRDWGAKTFPTPLDDQEGFFILPEHPHYASIQKWAFEARKLEDWLEEAKRYLNKTLRVMKHPKWVEHYWPELLPHVGNIPLVLTNGMREPRPTSMQLDMPLQDEIQNKLTMCSLLPKEAQHDAWIGRFMR